jgi:hypothetical protein
LDQDFLIQEFMLEEEDQEKEQVVLVEEEMVIHLLEEQDQQVQLTQAVAVVAVEQVVEMEVQAVRESLS